MKITTAVLKDNETTLAELVRMPGDILPDPWPYKLMRLVKNEKTGRTGLVLCDVSTTPERLIDSLNILKITEEGKKYAVVKVKLEIIAV